MNKLLKIIISVLGGINTIFTIFIPTLVALLIIDLVALNSLNQQILLLAGLLSTLYRALSYVIPLFEN